MLGVGLSELAVILFIAALVIGPERLPDMVKQAGRMLRQLRTLANSARDELRSELGPEYADLELTDLDPRKIVRKQLIEAMDEDEDDAASPPRRRPTRRVRPLGDGERPPYDPDAT